MSRFIFVLLALLWQCALAFSAAANQLEIITLRYRTAAQVIPALKPLVEPGGVISGMQNQLFLRVSRTNLTDLKRALESLDRLPRRLLVSVRVDDDAQSTRDNAGLSGRVGGHDGAVVIGSTDAQRKGAGVEVRGGENAIRARVERTRTDANQRIAQQVQVLDGGQALIQMGRSIPLTNRTIATTPRGKVLAESTEYRDQTSGFLVAPRVSGDLVTVDIRQQHSTQGTTPDSGNLEQLVTTVNGRLGEWITLGTSARDDEQQHRSIATRATLSGDSRRNIALKVEELR